MDNDVNIITTKLFRYLESYFKSRSKVDNEKFIQLNDIQLNIFFNDLIIEIYNKGYDAGVVDGILMKDDTGSASFAVELNKNSETFDDIFDKLYKRTVFVKNEEVLDNLK